MATPHEIRMTRLGNDYKTMVNIQGGIIQWQALRGNAPYVESYRLTVKVRSIIAAGPVYRDVHEISVELPAGYPKDPPQIKMISPVVFHPNWWKDSRWCYGNTWAPRESLGQHVIRMIRTLQFDQEITNPNSPANTDANSWYKDNIRSPLFPCDKQILPDPTKDKLQQQKTFVIH